MHVISLLWLLLLTPSILSLPYVPYVENIYTSPGYARTNKFLINNRFTNITTAGNTERIVNNNVFKKNPVYYEALSGDKDYIKDLTNIHGRHLQLTNETEEKRNVRKNARTFLYRTSDPYQYFRLNNKYYIKVGPEEPKIQKNTVIEKRPRNFKNLYQNTEIHFRGLPNMRDKPKNVTPPYFYVPDVLMDDPKKVRGHPRSMYKPENNDELNNDNLRNLPKNSEVTRTSEQVPPSFMILQRFIYQIISNLPQLYDNSYQNKNLYPRGPNFMENTPLNREPKYYVNYVSPTSPTTPTTPTTPTYPPNNTQTTQYFRTWPPNFNKGSFFGDSLSNRQHGILTNNRSLINSKDLSNTPVISNFKNKPEMEERLSNNNKGPQLETIITGEKVPDNPQRLDYFGDIPSNFENRPNYVNSPPVFGNNPPNYVDGPPNNENNPLINGNTPPILGNTPPIFGNTPPNFVNVSNLENGPLNFRGDPPFFGHSPPNLGILRQNYVINDQRNRFDIVPPNSKDMLDETADETKRELVQSATEILSGLVQSSDSTTSGPYKNITFEETPCDNKTSVICFILLKPNNKNVKVPISRKENILP